MSTEWVRDDMMSPISEVEQFGVKKKIWMFWNAVGRGMLKMELPWMKRRKKCGLLE